MQVTCPLLKCYLCHLDSLVLAGVSVFHGLGAATQLLVLNLPLHDRHTITNRNSGVCAPSDVDWAHFDAADEGNVATFGCKGKENIIFTLSFLILTYAF